MFSKKWAFILFLVLCNRYLLSAQYVKTGEFGKTYYDSNYQQVCEIFHHDLRYVFIDDSIRNKKVFKEMLLIKNGPYLSYYPNGKLESSGFYIDNEKDSTWLFYLPNGQLFKEEKYKNDILLK